MHCCDDNHRLRLVRFNNDETSPSIEVLLRYKLTRLVNLDNDDSSPLIWSQSLKPITTTLVRFDNDEIFPFTEVLYKFNTFNWVKFCKGNKFPETLVL